MEEECLMGIDPNNLPEHIIKAIDQRTLVIFIGAGVSKLCGLPSWDEMASRMINECTSLNISSEHKEQYSKISDPREKISLMHAIYNKENNESEFYAQIKKILTIEATTDEEIKNELNYRNRCAMQVESIRNIIDFIKLSYSSVITTNADDILDKECFGDSSNMVVCDLNKFDSIFDRDMPHIIHIHGSIKKIDEVKFTIKDYSALYTNIDFQKFIKRLFAERNVLFIGYGLKELELLVHIAAESSMQRHYVLMPYTLEKELLCDSYAELYGMLNIEQIPYSVGNGNYSRLNDILGSWIGELKQTRAPQEIIKNLERISRSEPNSDDATFLLYHMDGPYFDLFLGYLVNSQYGADWLVELSDKLFFDNGKLSSNLKGLKQDEGWYALKVLSVILKNNVTNDSLMTISIRLIDDVLSIFKEKNEIRMNDILHYDCACIISAIPGNLISETIVDYLKELDESKAMILSHFAGDVCNYVDWPQCSLVVIFKKMMIHMENNNYDVYPSDLFIENHLPVFVKIITKEIFEYSIMKIASVIAKDSSIYLDMGAISTYPDDCGIPIACYDDFHKILIRMARETIPYLSLEDKSDFIKNHYCDNDIFKRIALLMIFSTKELHPLLKIDHQKYIGPRCLISELYHSIITKLNIFDEDVVKSLVEIINVTVFEDQSSEIRLQLLCSLIHHSEVAKKYFKKGVDDFKYIENNNLYNASKIMWTSTDYDYFKEERCVVDKISKKDIVELVYYLSNEKNILKNHDDDYLKNEIFSKHLANVTLRELFDNISYYERLDTNYKRLVFSKIVNEKVNCEISIPHGVVNLFLHEIKNTDENWSGYGALRAMDALLYNFSSEQIKMLLDELMIKFNMMRPKDINWSKDYILSFYEKCLSTIFFLANRYRSLKINYSFDELHALIENKLEDVSNWQLRSVIYHNHWYLSYDGVECNERKIIFINRLVNMDVSIKLPCIFELLRAGCTEPGIIKWLLDADVIVSILIDDRIGDDIKKEVRYNFGELMGFITSHADVLFSGCCEKWILKNLIIIDGTMLSGYFEILNRYGHTDCSIEFTNMILEYVCRLEKISVVTKSLNQRTLCKYFIINEINEEGWKIISNSLSDRRITIFDELIGVLKKYSSLYDMNVLDLLIKISSGYLYIGQDEKTELVKIIDNYKGRGFDRKINEICNSLAKNGHLEMVKCICCEKEEQVTIKTHH